MVVPTANIPPFVPSASWIAIPGPLASFAIPGKAAVAPPKFRRVKLPVALFPSSIRPSAEEEILERPLKMNGAAAEVVIVPFESTLN